MERRNRVVRTLSRSTNQGLVLLTKYDTQWPEALKRALRLKNHYRA